MLDICLLSPSAVMQQCMRCMALISRYGLGLCAIAGLSMFYLISGLFRLMCLPSRRSGLYAFSIYVTRYGLPNFGELMLWADLSMNLPASTPSPNAEAAIERSLTADSGMKERIDAEKADDPIFCAVVIWVVLNFWLTGSVLMMLVWSTFCWFYSSSLGVGCSICIAPHMPFTAAASFLNNRRCQLNVLYLFAAGSLSQVSKGGEELHYKSIKGLFQPEAHRRWNPAITNQDLREITLNIPGHGKSSPKKPHTPTKQNTQPTASALRTGPSQLTVDSSTRRTAGRKHRHLASAADLVYMALQELQKGQHGNTG
ncbi:hypothetical protein Nepgr_027232 [Nepenthes gracilis]|uniref:Uncharacterized protein n=1 Tax=Nepenthes gracilis TaxID=150966 RepID=A0AAD3T9Y8_NEPGR|nr:hypothetical protein Nepgr_027232 [Nepenthes gracilis]